MSHEETWLIAVTAGRWQRHGIREARAAGLKVLAIDADSNAEGFIDSDLSINMNLDEHEAVAREVRALGKNIRGAVSFCSEAGMPLAAYLRDKFDLPGHRADFSPRLIDKAIQRRILTENGVPCPDWAVFSSPEKALAMISSLSFPLIIKPTDSSGSRGVTKIESVADEISSAVAQAFKFSKSGKIILESFMDGTEFTVEVFASDGEVYVLAVTEKKKVEGTRGTVAYELATPDIRREVIVRIQEAVVSSFRALGYRDGPGHAEVILMKDGSVGLVEVAGRGGGFLVFDRLVPAVSGVNIARLTALQAVGMQVCVGEICSRAVVLRFFPSKAGVLRKISGFDEANLIEGVDAGSFVRVGDRFNRAIADGDRLGYILSESDTPVRAQVLADQAEKLIYFDIDETI